MAKERYPIRVMDDARFMRAVAWVLMIFTFLGFVPTYFIPLSQGSFDMVEAWMHPHAIAGFAFAIVFIAQPTFILKRNMKMHRALGLTVGVAVIASVITGIGVQFEMFPRGQETEGKVIADSFRTFQLLPLLAGFFIAGVLMRKRPDWHWRLMYHAALAPFGTVMGRYIRMVPEIIPPESAGPMTSLLGLISVLVLPVSDFIRYRRIHAASWIGLVAFLITGFIALQIGFSDWWQGIALAG